MGLVSVNEWVELFKEIGLTQAQMDQWHRSFEKRNPEGHLSFLKWLGLSEDQIKNARSK